MKNDFKIGDTIRILKPTPEQKKNYGPTLVSGMDKYIGKTAIITKNDVWLRIDIDNGAYVWGPINFEKSISNNQLVWI